MGCYIGISFGRGIFSPKLSVFPEKAEGVVNRVFGTLIYEKEEQDDFTIIYGILAV